MMDNGQHAELRRLMDAYPARWVASQYLDTDEWGVVTTDNEIVVGVASRLTETAARFIADTKNALPGLLDELETTRTERDQARRNTVWLAEQYHLLRGVSQLSQERVRYWMQHAVTRRREALQQAADLVRRWHYRRGGYTELAHQIEQLAPSDAPPAGADAGAQARVELADALPGVVDEIMTGVQDEHVTLRDALPALQRWLRATIPPDAPRGPVAGAAGDDDVAYLTARGWQVEPSIKAAWGMTDEGVRGCYEISRAVEVQRQRDDVAYLYRTGWTRNLLDKWSHPEHTPQPVGRIVAVGMQRWRDGTQEVGETTSARIRAGISIRDWAYLNQRFWAYAEHYAINCWFDQETQGYYQTDAAVEIQRERDYLVTSGWGIQDDDEWYDGQGTLLGRSAAVARQRQRDGEVHL